jgi:hypothetical protein
MRGRWRRRPTFARGYSSDPNSFDELGLRHCPSHAGIELHECCDVLARRDIRIGCARTLARLYSRCIE